MTKKYSSFKNHQLITESWRSFLNEDDGPEHALGKWAKMFPSAAKALEAMGAKIEDIKKAIEDAQPETTRDQSPTTQPDEFGLGVFEQEEVVGGDAARDRMLQQQAIYKAVSQAMEDAVGDWIYDLDWPVVGDEDTETYVQKLNVFSMENAGVAVADVLKDK